MSMSEFERQENSSKESFSLAIHQPDAPDDFTEEDQAFAAVLNALFSPEEENLPPYYVQTLLDADDQRFEPVSREFEHKTSARVFRRLKLRRRLFYTHGSPLHALGMEIGDASVRRSVLAMVGTFIMVLLLTIAFTGASFASGIAILLHGTYGSGVYSIKNYPVGLVQRSQPDWQNIIPPAVQTSLLNAQEQMLFPVYSPGYMLPSYSLKYINLYVGLDQQWADGPMLEFGFSLPSSVTPRGTGEIWVREFKPRAGVLLLVEQNASVPIEMDGSGQAMAIYVNGEWSQSGKNAPRWEYNIRSELIYQVNGVVFWIVGDQRDNVGKQQLMDIAQGLAPIPFNQQFRMLGSSAPVTQLSEDVPGPFSNDVVVVYPSDSSDGCGPYYLSVSSYQPPKNVH